MSSSVGIWRNLSRHIVPGDDSAWKKCEFVYMSVLVGICLMLLTADPLVLLVVSPSCWSWWSGRTSPLCYLPVGFPESPIQGHGAYLWHCQALCCSSYHMQIWLPGVHVVPSRFDGSGDGYRDPILLRRIRAQVAQGWCSLGILLVVWIPEGSCAEIPTDLDPLATATFWFIWT